MAGKKIKNYYYDFSMLAKQKQAFDKKQKKEEKALRSIIVQSTNLTPYAYSQTTVRPRSIEDAIKERERLKNKSLNQDIKLRRYTLVVLFIFLGFETAAVFLFAFFQGVHFLGFSLEDWSFRILIAATITQITLMLQIAVKYLYPQPKENET